MKDKNIKQQVSNLQQNNQPIFMNMRFNWLYKAGCVSMVSLVAMGAIYGHQGALTVAGQKLFQKALFYHFTNTFGLFAASLINQSKPNRAFKVAIFSFLFGYLFFVGPLYYRAISGHNEILGKLMPVGGLSIITSWTALIFA